MIGYIINWTNILWGLALAAALVGANRYTNMPERKQEELLASVKKLRRVAPLTTIVLVVWLALRCLYALGLLLQVELLLVFGAVCYLTRIEARSKAIQTHQAYALLQNTENLKSILGNDLPEWAKYPGANRALWINTVITELWSSITAATETSLRAVIGPLLETHRPSFINALVLKELFLGNNPIVINGIQHHPSRDSSSIVDLTISWDSDTNIHLLVKLLGPDMHVYIRRFQVNMQLRIILSPHIPVWPCFASISLSIMKIWLLDFDISAAGVSLDTVPAVGKFLDKFIRDTLIGALQYPKKVTIPIVRDYAAPSTRADSAVGTLRVSLVRVEEWEQRYVSERKNTPFYVKLVMLGVEKKKRLKSNIYKGLNSELQDKFSFVLYDKNKTLHFWLYFDLLGNDYCVGECDVSVQLLLANKVPEHTCHMVKPGSVGLPRAKLIISYEFLPYTNKNKNELTAAPHHVPTRTVSEDFIKHAVTAGRPLELPSMRSTVNGSCASEGVGSGTLFVTVVGCTGLKNKEHIGVSDPYVLLRLGEQAKQSHYMSSTLEPTFNFEAEFDVLNNLTDVLQVMIMDKNDVRKDALMGSLRIPIANVASSVEDQISGQFNLDPQGKVQLTLRLLRH